MPPTKRHTAAYASHRTRRPNVGTNVGTTGEAHGDADMTDLFLVLASTLSALAALIAILAGLLHLYWAAGGRWGFDVAIPEDAKGGPAFVPGPALTALVAGLLFVFAAMVLAPAWLLPGGAPSLVVLALRVGLGSAALILFARVLCDRDQSGLLRRRHDTRFARLDARLYTPLVAVLCLGALAALART